MCIRDSDYIDSVCRNIRSRRERELFRAELSDHIEQKTAELMRGGRAQEEAERAAVESLGPAKTISKGMNAVYRPAAVKYIFLATTLFLAFLNAAPWLAFLFNIPNMPLAVFPAEGDTCLLYTSFIISCVCPKFCMNPKNSGNKKGYRLLRQ